MLTLELPFPPSANRYYRNLRGRTLISRDGRSFRTQVSAIIRCGTGGGSRKPPSGGRIALLMDAFPPDRRRRDLDNLQKATNDALQHAGVFEDDSQIDLLIARRNAADPDHGHVRLTVATLPLEACLLCGSPLLSPEDN